MTEPQKIYRFRVDKEEAVRKLDQLAHKAYIADCQAQGDPLIMKWTSLQNEYKKRYRAIAQAVLDAAGKQDQPNKQTVTDALRDILNDSNPLERKIRALMHEQGINLSDAPYGLASALERLENFRDDIRNAIDDIETREG